MKSSQRVFQTTNSCSEQYCCIWACDWHVSVSYRGAARCQCVYNRGGEWLGCGAQHAAR